jgi:hypothetical protein
MDNLQTNNTQDENKQGVQSLEPTIIKPTLSPQNSSSLVQLPNQLFVPPQSPEVSQPVIIPQTPQHQVVAAGIVPKSVPKKRSVLKIALIVILVLFVLLAGAYIFITHNLTASRVVVHQVVKQNHSISGTTNSAIPATTATEAANVFLNDLRSSRKSGVDSMLSPSFKAQIKQQTGTESYYDNCTSQCPGKLVLVDKSLITSQSYKSTSGMSGETIIFKSPSNQGGFNIVQLSMIKLNGYFLVDNESDGASTN